MSSKNRIIAVMQNKGGAGKTTTCFNIAKNFIRNNRNVICVDFDAQEQLQTMLPEITLKDVKAEDLADIEADYVIVDTGPTFVIDHLDLIEEASLVVIPVQLESLDIEQTIKLLRTISRVGHADKARLLVTHAGKNTVMFKNLYPMIQGFAEEFEVEILAVMRKSQAVAQANLMKKTVFEINSPPEVRAEFKDFFKALGKTLAEVAPIPRKPNPVGEAPQSHA